MEMAQVRKRTRAPAALSNGDATTSPKKRMNDLVDDDNMFSPTAEERCTSLISDESPASCCSSNRSLDVDEIENRIIKFSDPEVESAQSLTSTTCDYEYDNHIIRKEKSLSNDLRSNSPEMESVEKKPTASKKMPTESELEEFFAAAEKDIQKRFSCKYNYDIVKDVPLEGRYEWVQLKP